MCKWMSDIKELFCMQDLSVQKYEPQIKPSCLWLSMELRKSQYLQLMKQTVSTQLGHISK